MPRRQSRLRSTLLLLDQIEKYRKESREREGRAALSDLVRRTNARLDTATTDEERAEIKAEAMKEFGPVYIRLTGTAPTTKQGEALGFLDTEQAVEERSLARAATNIDDLISRFPVAVETPPAPVIGGLEDAGPLRLTDGPLLTSSLRERQPGEVTQRRLSELLQAAGGSKPALEAFKDPQVLGQFQAEGALKGPAEFQAKESNIRLNAILERMPPEMRKNLLLGVTEKPAGIETTLKEPTSPPEVLASESRRIPGGPEARKEFVSPAEDPSKRLTRREAARSAVGAIQNKISGLTEFGPVLPAQGPQLKQLETQLMDAMSLAQQEENEAARLDGRQPVEMYRGLSAMKAKQRQELAALRDAFLKKEGRYPTEQELEQIYFYPEKKK